MEAYELPYLHEHKHQPPSADGIVNGSSEKAKQASPEINQEPAKKSWILPSVVLLTIVSCAILEAQLTTIGFRLPEESAANHSCDATTSTCSAEKKELKFQAPHFYTLCRFMARVLAFPLLFCGMWIHSLVMGRPFSAKQFYKHSAKIAQTESVGFRRLWDRTKLFGPPILTSIGISVGVVVSFVYISASTSVACFSSVVAMSYVLSVIFLKHPILVVKVIFIMSSFGGVALVAWETTHSILEPNAYIGILAVLFAAAMLALYQLTSSRSFPNSDVFQSAFLVTVIYTVAITIYWPVPLVLKLQGAEVWNIDDVPWGYLLGGVFSSSVVGFLYAYGISISSPFYMSLGELLNMTISGVIDHLRGIDITPLQVAGFVIIGLSFTVLILPNDIVTIDALKKRLTNCVPVKKAKLSVTNPI